jgi:hypothetical protein
MNRGTRMSSALALVTPRAVGDCVAVERAVVNPDAPVDAVLPTSAGEELLVVAKVPDLWLASAPSSVASKAAWKPSWNLPRPKFRVAYVKLAAIAAGLDFATCWAWVITLPPIVKLGTVMASIVMSLWVFGGNDADTTSEPSATSAWHQDDTPRSKAAADAPSAEKAPAELQPIKPAIADEKGDEAIRLARDSARSENPTIREIQQAARGSSAPANDDGFPRVAEVDNSIARGMVRQIPTHKEPHPAATDRNVPQRASYADNALPREGHPNSHLPVDAGSREGDRRPPEMPRDWAERPVARDTAGYPSVRANPYYENTVVAETPRRPIDNRDFDNRGYDNRPNTNAQRTDSHGVHSYGVDSRVTGPRYADNRGLVAPTAEDLEAERRARWEAYQASRRRLSENQSPTDSHRR